MHPALLYPLVFILCYAGLKIIERWIKTLMKEALLEAIEEHAEAEAPQQLTAPELIAHLGTFGHFEIKH